MKRSLVKVCSLLAVGFISAAALNAADAPAPGGAGRPERPGGPGGPRGPMGGILDSSQLQTFREAMQKNNEELRALNDKLQAAQKELVQATIAEKYDEKAVREKAEAVSKIQTDITVLRAKAFSSVSPTLKPEQREQLANSRMGAMMVLGGGMGGGMGGPGGPGGEGRPARRGPGGPGGREQ